ncbi:MAG: DUF6465 family protein [Lachnospiraceae bacterium]|nr:DUF6465 family protein [Lachnospiraceae bacterium]
MAVAKKAAAKTTAAKAETKKAATAKTETKKAAAPRCTTTVNIELEGLSVTPAQVQNAVKKAVKQAGLTPSSLNIYINTVEKAAYYTVDGVAEESYKVDLTAL